MNLQEIVGLCQAGAITAAFLIFVLAAVYKGPGLFAAWLASKEKLAELEAKEAERRRTYETVKDERDMKSRHDSVAKLNECLATVCLQHKEEMTAERQEHREAMVAERQIFSETIKEIMQAIRH